MKAEAEAYNFINNETLVQVFSCKFSEISKKTFFTENLWVTASEEHMRMAASAFLETVLQDHFSHYNLAKGAFDETKIKGCSNHSRLKKNLSYHKVLGEYRND